MMFMLCMLKALMPVIIAGIGTAIIYYMGGMYK